MVEVLVIERATEGGFKGYQSGSVEFSAQLKVRYPRFKSSLPLHRSV